MSNRVGGPRGDAIIKVKNESGRALSGQLTYTPSPAGAYEVRAGANRSAAEAAEVVRTDDEGKTYGPASHTEAYIRIVPAAAVIPDVSEPEMAKAAQWCVEQGILTAPGETTFRPNGWVTRVKVIQTWNTAFPKQ